MAAICFRNIGSAVGISIVIAQLTSMIIPRVMGSDRCGPIGAFRLR